MVRNIDVQHSRSKGSLISFSLAANHFIVWILRGFPVINSFFVQSWLLLIKLSIYWHFFLIVWNVNRLTIILPLWTFPSLLTVYSSPFWPLQCQCLLFIKSVRFITRRLANNGTDSGRKLSNYATRRGSGFNFVTLVRRK